MKYISLIIFTAALAWTWNVVHSTSPISFETHSGIQERLAEFIVETVKAKRPNASEVLVHKVWTEAIAANKVKAFFIYTFKDVSDSGPVSSQIQGEGILERQPADESGNDRWTLTKIHTNSDSVEFADATIVTGSPNGSSDTAPESTTPSAEPEHPAEH